MTKTPQVPPMAGMSPLGMKTAADREPMNVLAAARALLYEIDHAKGVRTNLSDRHGRLDRLHPISIFAEHLNTALLLADGESPEGKNAAKLLP